MVDTEPTDIIHPYILQALQDARSGDPDALAWLQSDCIGWELIEPNAAIMAVKEIYRPAREPRQKQQRPATMPLNRTRRDCARNSEHSPTVLASKP